MGDTYKIDVAGVFVLITGVTLLLTSRRRA